MKILILNTTDQGGAANACIRLHLGLLKSGIESRLLLLSKSNENIPECYTFLQENRSLGKRIAQNAGYRLNKFLKKRKTRGISHDPDLFKFPTSGFDITRHWLYDWAQAINFHWVADFLDWPSFFRKNTKPIAWTLHDMLPFTGGYHYEYEFPFDRYRKQITDNLRIKQQALKNRTVNIIALNKWMKARSEESALFKSFPHHLIPNGISTSVFQPLNSSFARQALGLPQDKKVLLFTATSLKTKRKGFNYLMEAIPLLSKEVVLGVVGDNIPSVMLQKENVFSLGKINDERLMALAYSAADLFVIPSIEDNLPNTVIESLACGTPVAGFRIGGVPDMVIPGQNGLLCEEIGPVELAATIEKALMAGFDRASIRQDAVRRFDQSVQAKAYIELFHSILESA